MVAKEFQPPSLFGYSNSVKQYPYNPAKSRALLKAAGLKLPVKINFWYPTSVSRPYMPDPVKNFQAFSASLTKSGFKVVPHAAPWNPDYLGGVQDGKAQVYLYGWTGDFGDPDDFAGVFFRTPQKQWGFNNPAIFNILTKARDESNLAKRIALYKQANNMIMNFLPGVPYVHTSPALAFAQERQRLRSEPGRHPVLLERVDRLDESCVSRGRPGRPRHVQPAAERRVDPRCSGSSFAACCCSSRSCSGSRSSSSSGSGRCPGSPAQALLGERATPETIRQINHQYGLDKPIYVQYWRVPQGDGAAPARHLDHDAGARAHRDRAALPGDHRARGRGGVLRDRRSGYRSASSLRSST